MRFHVVSLSLACLLHATFGARSPQNRAERKANAVSVSGSSQKLQRKSLLEAGRYIDRRSFKLTPDPLQAIHKLLLTINPAPVHRNSLGAFRPLYGSIKNRCPCASMIKFYGAKSSLGGSACSLQLNIGFDPGWKTEKFMVWWPALGARISVPVLVNFTDEIVDLGILGEKALGDGYAKRLECNGSSFVGPSGQVNVTANGGAWKRIPYGIDGVSQLRFFVDFSGSTSCGDVSFPPGRVFFTSICYDSYERFEELQKDLRWLLLVQTLSFPIPITNIQNFKWNDFPRLLGLRFAKFAFLFFSFILGQDIWSKVWSGILQLINDEGDKGVKVDVVQGPEGMQLADFGILSIKDNSEYYLIGDFSILPRRPENDN